MITCLMTILFSAKYYLVKKWPDFHILKAALFWITCMKCYVCNLGVRLYPFSFRDLARFCYEDDCTKEDPLSHEGFRKLALPLPYSKQNHSKLVCYISKELMDTENPPLVLPNGYVYSTKVCNWSHITNNLKSIKVMLTYSCIIIIIKQALEEMAKQNHGKITCPRTGLVCDYTDLNKVYVSWKRLGLELITCNISHTIAFGR